MPTTRVIDISGKNLPSAWPRIKAQSAVRKGIAKVVTQFPFTIRLTVSNQSAEKEHGFGIHYGR